MRHSNNHITTTTTQPHHKTHEQTRIEQVCIHQAQKCFWTHPKPKNSWTGPEKLKMTPNLQKLKKSEDKKFYKSKVISEHE